MKNINNNQSGFIALMSAIIISAVLMVVVFGVSFSGFMTRFNILDDEYKAKSYSLAEGYASEAFIKFAQKITENPSYVGETVTISTPDYYRIIVSGSNITIEAHSVYQKATTNIRITATYSGGSLIINDWEEVPSL